MIKVNKGFLLTAAVALLVVGSIVAVLIAHMTSSDFSGTKSDSDSTQAFYIASAGLERAIHSTTTNDLSNRISCANISGNSNFTNALIGNGEFTVTATNHTVTSASLTTGISDSATIIPVTSLSGYAPTGRIVINTEAIDYTSSSTNSSSCAGSAPCFTGVTRGAGGTVASSQSSGDTIVQTFCQLISTGLVPNANSPTGKRIISVNIFQVESGWIVGNTVNGSENLLAWSGDNWTQTPNSLAIPDVHYFGIEMLNYADGWTVGQNADGSATLLHFDGNGWTRILPAAGTADKTLNDVSCIHSNDCWAVGDAMTFLHWDGSSWTTGLTSSLPNKAVHAVDCTASDNCWAVAQQQISNPLLIRWNGTQWAEVTTGLPNVDFNDITCLSSHDCWAVGAGSTFAHWDGSAWSNVLPDADVPNKDIRSISCVASNNCWAVGSPQGGDSLIVHWDGSNWSRITPAAEVPNSSLLAISCANSNDCWATGNSGTIIHWDGELWSNGTLGTIPNATMQGIAILGALDNEPLITNWNEV